MGKYSIKLFLVLFLSFVVNLSANVVGATKGEFSVTQGNAAYNLEILTPKGTAGLKPSLSISYSSANNMNGLLGVGFSINGLSQISKCNQTLFDEKKDSTRNYNYCLDGQKLVTKNQNDTYGSNTEYRTEIDSYSKVIKDSSGWIVYTKDGLIYEYGKTSDSKDLDVFYRVNKIKDRYNNEINFVYDTTLKAILKITYSNNTIDFIYEDREDIKDLFIKNVNIKANKRLSSISIKTANQDVSSYILDYKNVNNRSIVNSIKECVFGKCLEPIFFDWNNSGLKKYSSFELWGNNASTSAQHQTVWSDYSKIIDINGDGLADRMHHHNYTTNQTGYWVQINSSNGFGPMENWGQNATYPHQYRPEWAGGEYSTSLDVNGDGLPDRIHHHNYATNQTGYWVQVNTGSGFGPMENWGRSASSFDQYRPNWAGGEYSTFLDVNGDGLPDRIHHHNYATNKAGYWVQLNTGSSFGRIENWGTNATHSYQYRPNWAGGEYSTSIDINGDGLPDRVHHYNYSTKEFGYWIQLNTGSGFGPMENWGQNATYPDQYRPNWGGGEYSAFVDVNADGLPDRVHHYNYKTNETGYWVQLNTGSSFGPMKNWGSNATHSYQYRPTWGPYSMFTDINSDGLVDRVHHYNYSTKEFGYWVQLNTGSSFAPIEKWEGSTHITEQYRVNWTGYSKYIDINGDGILDRYHHHKYSTRTFGHWVQLSEYRTPELRSITNHKDQTIDIEYSTLNDKEIYSSTQDLNYPNREVKSSAMKVVKSYSIDDGIGEKNKTSYKYKNFAFNIERGSLGFEEVETLSETTNSKTIVTFNQNFPFIGTVKKTESFVNNKKISTQTNSYLSYSNERHIIRFQLRNTLNITYDYNSGNELVRKETMNDGLGQYGTVGKITTITSTKEQEFTKIVNNIYENSESNWILARLKKSEVTHKNGVSPDIKRKSSFEYDPNTGTLNKEVIEPTNSKSLTKTYIYNSYGNKHREVVSGTDITTRTTTYLYDAYQKNIVHITNPLSQTEERKYNIRNQLVSLIGPNKLETTWEYDEMGRKVREDRADGTFTTWTHYWDNSLENSLYAVREKTNYLPEVVVYYDQYARKLRTVTTGFDGRKIYKDTQYNKIGKVSKEYIPYFENETSNQAVETTYDALGRIVTIKKPDAQGRTVEYTTTYNDFEIIKTDPKGNSKTTTYNALEKKIKVQDSIATREYEYDSIGNLISTTDEKNNTILMTYDVFGHKINMTDPDMGHWKYKYNVLGELKEQTDAKGQITYFKYDQLGRKTDKFQGGKVSKWRYDVGTKAVGKLHYEHTTYGSEKSYTYDNLGRVSTETSVLNGKIFTRSFAYDEFGRIDYIIEPNSFKIYNEYNQYGYLIAKKTLKEQISNFDQQEFDSLISEAQANEQLYYEKYLNLKENIFDMKSKLVDYKNSYSSPDYDSLVQTVELAIQQLEVELAATQRQVDYYRSQVDYYKSKGGLSAQIKRVKAKNKYNDYVSIANDLLLKISDANTSIPLIEFYIEELSSLNAQLIQLEQEDKNQKEYVNTKNIFKVSDTNYNYFYKALEKDAFGRDIKFISGNGVITNEYYDSSGLLLETTSGYETSSSYIRNLAYEYDKNNNVSLREDKKLAVIQNYTYDSIDRLTDVYIDTKNTSEHISYEYDALGNITYKSDVGYYSYSSSSPHQVVQAGNKTFAYDTNGNMTNNDGAIITYDYSNKPIRMEKGSSVVTFKYDMNDSRFEKTSNGTTMQYIGKSYEYITHKNGNIEEKYYIYANGKVAAIQSNLNDGYKVTKNISYLHYDNLGSVDTITNNLGVVEQRMAYKPFGDRMALDKYGNEIDKSALKTNRGYTGHEHIDEFNFIHMNGRVYDPVIARFMSADPHIQAPYDTQSFNRYTYVKNNPLKYTDPSGFFFKKIKKFLKKIDIKTSLKYGLVLGFKPVQKFFIKYKWAQLAGSIVAGRLFGAIGTTYWSMYLTDIQGGSFGDVVKSGAIAFASAYVAHEIGVEYKHETSYFTASISEATKKNLAHGLSRAFFAKLQGQDPTAQFWSGFVSSGFAAPESLGFELGTATMMIVGGTTSKITGGKFANGAVTAAFIHMFNKYGKLAKFINNSYKVAYGNGKGELVRNHYGTREQHRSALIKGLLTYYGTISAVGGVSAAGKAAWFLWGTGAAVDTCSVYNSGDLSQGTGSAAGMPQNGKPGAIIGAITTLYNNFFR